MWKELVLRETGQTVIDLLKLESTFPVNLIVRNIRLWV